MITTTDIPDDNSNTDLNEQQILNTIEASQRDNGVALPDAARIPVQPLNHY